MIHPNIRLAVWLLIPLHFVVVGLSYLSLVAPSNLHTQVVDVARPYLMLLHLDAEGSILSFSTDAKAEKTHRLQQTESTPADRESIWTDVLEPGFVGADRQRRWQRLLVTIAQVSEADQAALAGRLIEPIAMMNPAAGALRIVREPDLMTNVVDDAAEPPYTVAILRSDDSAVRLVRVPSRRMAAESVRGDDE